MPLRAINALLPPNPYVRAGPRLSKLWNEYVMQDLDDSLVKFVGWVGNSVDRVVWAAI